MKRSLRQIWCDLTHGGGVITRDNVGRINWQCCRCGRWGEPISLDDEARMTDRAIAGRQALKDMEDNT